MTATKSRTDLGWPLHKGPRATLLSAGLIRTPEELLKWARDTDHNLAADGSTRYTAFSGFIALDGIRALAALTFEGYSVRLDTPSPGKIRITITNPDEKENR